MTRLLKISDRQLFPVATVYLGTAVARALFLTATFCLATFFIGAVFMGTCLATGQLSAQTTEKIEFNRDVRPILSDRCFQCHGPDEKKREADLRFDLEKEAKSDLGGYRAIVPGDRVRSVLVDRILSDDPDERMPPSESGKSLTEQEKQTLVRWIEQGASFEKHWSFMKLSRPGLPTVKNKEWIRNEIDHFILHRLESQGLRPSPPAEPGTLIRRLYLDLTGLLPPVELVKQFVENPSDDAYEKIIDDLLASPHFGERMGRHWLDLARYADSNGYANDGLRSVWPYRDWVIKALNDDLPFDQFTIEQMAGDLLPQPTLSQKIATGFHRNTPLQTEGGSDPEQYRVERTKNRTDTTGAVWLGLTVGCAQCHTHKFDPITHQEYYQLYAFFNDVDEPTLRLNETPLLGKTHSPQKVANLRERLAEIDRRLNQMKNLPKSKGIGSQPSWKPLEFSEIKSLGGATLTKQMDGSILASGKNPSQDTYELIGNTTFPVQAIRIETLTHPSLPQKGPGRAGNGNFVLAELGIQADGKRVTVLTATADHSQKGYSVQDAFDNDLKTGWAINVNGGTLNVNRTAVFTLDKKVQGRLRIRMTTYEQGKGYNIGRFRIGVSENPPPGPDPKRLALEQQRSKIQKEIDQILKTAPTTLAISQRSRPRESFVQIRGDFLDPGPKVTPGTLRVLPEISTQGERPNRLHLAKWLVSKDHPLTPRVQANRIWQHLFGVGLVETENDFGYQGSLPSHPGLLDHLARDLIENGWRMKRMYKRIALSATYRQSSIARADARGIDPKNRWLARQNRYRVEGEIVRDVALDASGLLSRKLGGKSVFPPIPPNVIGTSSANHRWPTSQGADRYRRGIYTAIYRANVYPMLLSFDGPDRDNACTRRGRSNTPLQALTVANDETFIEFAQRFGKRIADHNQASSVSAKIKYAYLVALSRLPLAAESARLEKYHNNRVQYYRANPSAASQLTGEKNAQLAAWVCVARVLLNLDEFITRE